MHDFLARADVLAACGMTVLISDYFEYYRLAAYLARNTSRKLGVVMGAGSLRELFDEQYYADLDGGILESFGRLFKNDLKLYVYPLLDQQTGELVTGAEPRGRARVCASSTSTSSSAAASSSSRTSTRSTCASSRATS